MWLKTFSSIFFVFFSLNVHVFLYSGVKNGLKGESTASDEEMTSDILSHYSSASESASVMEESTGLYRDSGCFMKCPNMMKTQSLCG